MALESAKTLTTKGIGGESIKNTYYDQLFLRQAEKKLIHKQLGQLNRKIGSGEGGYNSNAIMWTKWLHLPLITAGTAEGVPTATIQMTAQNVSGSTAQYDNAVSISDIMAYASFGDVMKSAVERLAYNAGLSIDTIISKVLFSGGTQQTASGAAYWSATPAGANLLCSEIRKAARTLSANDAFEQEDGSWVAVVHPHAIYDLQGDATIGGWVTANTYADNAGGLMSGEVGKLYGVRFLQTTNAAVRGRNTSGGTAIDSGSAVVSSTTVYVTSIFGKDAFGVSELQSLKTYVKPFGSGGVGDPTDKIATAGWKCLFGAKVLNSDFFVNINHTVASTA
jgi:N4-gp56 family major capsid protein